MVQSVKKCLLRQEQKEKKQNFREAVESVSQWGPGHWLLHLQAKKVVFFI